MAGRPKTRAKREAAEKAAAGKNTPRKKAESKTRNPKKPVIKRGRSSAGKVPDGEAIPTFVSSYIALGKILGVTRQALNRWSKLDGSPKAKSDGRHSVKEWLDFMKSNDLAGKSHDLNSLKARDLLARCEEREFNYAVKRGMYVSLEDVRLSWSSCTAKALQMLEKALLDELPPILAGMDPIDIRKKNEQQLNEVRRLLHSGGGLTP